MTRAGRTVRKLVLTVAALLCGAAGAATAPTTCTAPDGSVLSYTAPGVVVAPPTPPPASGIVYGYQNGVFSWGGDFTQTGTSVNYHDTVGDPGRQDIAFSSSVQWGLYLPYFGSQSANYLIPNPGYKALTFGLKTTRAAGPFTVYFIRSGDLPTNCSVTLSPAPQPGVWVTYTVSLASLCVATDKQLYKFGLQDHSGVAPTVWYMRDLGFTL